MIGVGCLRVFQRPLCLAILAVGLLPACGPSRADVDRLQRQARTDLADILRERPEGGPMAADAAVLLVRNGDPADVAAVVAQLDDLGDPYVFPLVRELGRAGRTEAVAQLEALFGRTANPVLKVEAGLALARLGQTDKVAWLIDVLQNDSLATHRASAAAALGELPAPAAHAPLLSALAYDPEPLVQASAAAALGRLGDRSAVEPLWQAAKRTSQMSVAVAAVGALGRLGGPRAAACLAEAVKQPTWREDVKRPCLVALDRLGSRDVGRYLERVASSDTNQVLTRVQAVEGLGLLQDTSAVPLLRSAFGSDRRNPLRLSAAWSLARLGAADDIADEVALDLDHGDPGFQAHAAEILGMIGAEDQVGALQKKLGPETEPIARVAATEALRKIGSPAALAALAKALSEAETAPDKINIVTAIGNTGTPSALDILAGLLKQTDSEEVRAATIEALGACGNPEALFAIEPYLTSSVPELRFQAAAAILRLTTGVWLGTAG